MGKFESRDSLNRLENLFLQIVSSLSNVRLIVFVFCFISQLGQKLKYVLNKIFLLRCERLYLGCLTFHEFALNFQLIS